MKIKTKEQIFHCVNDGIPIKINWVAVDELLELIEKLKERFGARPKANKGEEQDRFISYIDLKNALSKTHRSPKKEKKK